MKLIDFRCGQIRPTMIIIKSLTGVERGLLRRSSIVPMESRAMDGCVYAICATIYYMLTGKSHRNLLERTYEDTLQSFDELEIPVDKEKSDALMKGLAPIYQNRYQSIPDLQRSATVMPEIHHHSSFGRIKNC